MNSIENYESILRDIFGIEFKYKNRDLTNNCIGALNGDNFKVFKENFIQRLKRLSKYYKNTDGFNKVFETAKEIGLKTKYKWSGPYAELVALDYWTRNRNIQNVSFVDKGNSDRYGSSIAEKIGQKILDLDISLDLASKRIYTDVKSFIPTHIELAGEIMDKVEERVTDMKFLIGIDGIYDVDYLRTKNDLLAEIRKGGTLIDQLVSFVKNRQVSCSFELKSGEKLNFRMAYDNENRNEIILSTIREHNPYLLANNYKFKMLDYYNKYLINKPSIITLVVNPWFNQELNTNLDGSRDIFFRSFARRVFIDLNRNDELMSDYYPDFENTDIKISDISKLITGIHIIYDESIMISNRSRKKDIYNSYIFLNPNATNEKLRWGDFDILSWGERKKHSLPFFDDFFNDNY